MCVYRVDGYLKGTRSAALHSARRPPLRTIFDGRCVGADDPVGPPYNDPFPTVDAHQRQRRKKDRRYVIRSDIHHLL